MSQVQEGSKVKVHYTGKLNDGTVFDTSKEREPLEFTVGEKNVIPGFEQGLVGMEPGQSKTISIGSDDAYGNRVDELVQEVPRSQFPEHITPTIGQRLELKAGEDQKMIVTVTEVGDEKVTLDGNHPLAGKDLVFDVELLEVA